MEATVGVVEPKDMALNLPEGGFKCWGGTLKAINVRYEECGVPMTDSNVIFFCHALTGDAHVAGIRPGEKEPSGWWENMVGPGKAFDTNKFHIVCANVLGGCQGTTGPMSINPDTGKPYGSLFPKYTHEDAVNVYRLFLQQLGVKKLAALVGGSYGGMQVIEWITRHPGEVDKALMIATSAALNTQALAFDLVGRASIKHDPDWRGGDYYLTADGKGPKRGLMEARQLAHITYLSRELLQEKFGRRLQPVRGCFQIESYLDHQGVKFINRFDANSYLHITRALDQYDLAEEWGSYEAAFARVTSKCLVVSYSNDVLFTEWESKEIVNALLKNKKEVSYCHLESGTGHDSFLTDIDDLAGVVSGFLLPRNPKVMKWQKRLYRKVTGLVKDHAHVIDLGCGDGSLLNVLREQKSVTGDGVEIDIDKYKEAFADDHPIFWADTDEGLDFIPDKYYDTAILSETLQVVKNPRGLLREALRIADDAIVTFPNFAEYHIRLSLSLRGRLPVSKALPFEWYDTPNIHCVTLKDFKRLCDAEGIEIVEKRCEGRGILGRLLVAVGLRNLGAARVIARIRRKAK